MTTTLGFTGLTLRTLIFHEPKYFLVLRVSQELIIKKSPIKLSGKVSRRNFDTGASGKFRKSAFKSCTVIERKYFLIALGIESIWIQIFTLEGDT